MASSMASVATLVLFVLYFIGRIITIFAVDRLWADEVIFDKRRFHNYGIVEEVGDGNSTYGLLTTTTGLRNVEIFDVVEDKYGIPNDKGKLLYQRPFLNVHQAIAINEETGELHPTLIIEYLTFDFMKVRLEWRDNLKNGVYSELVRPKHTWKSFLFYLCR